MVYYAKVGQPVECGYLVRMDATSLHAVMQQPITPAIRQRVIDETGHIVKLCVISPTI